MEQLNNLSDDVLTQMYIDGNNRAFDELLSRNNEKLFSYIIFVVRDRDVANDILQETFVKAICRLKEGQYTSCGKFNAWLMRIAHNAIMDWYRSHKVSRIVELTPDNSLSNVSDSRFCEGNIESRYVNEQIQKDIKLMVDLLPANQREVVFMRYFKKMSFKEIASLTNVSINTSLGRMRYALFNLRRMAKQYDMELELV